MAAPPSAHGGDVFDYTSGRWLYNEKRRLHERHLTFNVSALLEAAARSVHQSKEDIKSFRKLAEGGFNRVFELTMRNGLQIIARLPYPSTQPKLLATASEVATMDLVRKYEVPAPKVYAYSTDAGNAVGSEYIIMEKVSGRCLGDIWYELSDRQRVRVLGDIVDQEAKLFSIPLPAHGSIYDVNDLPHGTDRATMEVEAGRFCVGPDVSLTHWCGTRSELQIMRRPAMTSQQVLEDGAKKEIEWLRAYGKPRLPFDREYREMFNDRPVDPNEHLRNLEEFLKVAAYLVPGEDWLNQPVIRHPDLNPNNIFVDDGCRITSIIDWQHTTVLPLFLHAGIPSSLQNHGDPDSEPLKKPEYPSNLDELDEDDRRKDLHLYLRRLAHYYYIGATIAKLQPHYWAMTYDRGLFRKKLYQHAVEPWEGNSIPLKAHLMMLAADWSRLTGAQSQGDGDAPPCPLSIPEQEVGGTVDKMVEQEKIDRNMEILRDAIGISTDGWVSFERYDGAVAAADEMKAQALGFAESDFERDMIERHWPFDDFDEDGCV
ncbi:26S protease regulatory subunit 4 [Teratosphaeria destructans]|uniref:26S protease regulatory subunit 4 n=1 Tax=Teratosphaeria destructans TaxID=418781 RepID=A0A9W7SW42_9PEZI|nr:26S protease regulatory subunit 4 [Teratosphaeria destructans]